MALLYSHKKEQSFLPAPQWRALNTDAEKDTDRLPVLLWIFYDRRPGIRDGEEGQKEL
jgi:hypothetical protein